MSSSPRLTVEGLKKVYREEPVLDGVDLAVPAGRAVAVMGANGSGKTTLLRCLTGHVPCSWERLALDGYEVTVHSSRYRTAVFPVFDDFAFFSNLTVEEHLAFLAATHGVARVADQVQDSLRRFGVTSLRNRQPGTLSSGEIRRVAFAASSLRPWRLLLLDEPEQRLDGAGRHAIVQYLRERLADGGSLLFASHDQDLVRALDADVLEIASRG